MKYLAVANFARFQHYRHRRPTWIKFYGAILDDYAFIQLGDAAKAHLMLLWQVAATHGNRIPNDPKYIQLQTKAHNKIDLAQLIAVGFLIDADTLAELAEPASTVLAENPKSAIPEKSRVEKSREEKKVQLPRAKPPRAVDSDFETAWQQYPKRGGGNSKAAAQRKWVGLRLDDISVADLIGGVQRYAHFCAATGKVGTELVMQASRFFGPDESWREQWALPVAPTNPNERTAAKVPSAAEGRAAAEREKADDERRARIDRAYVAARTVVVREWAMQQPPEVFAAIEAKVAVIFGGMTGPMAAEIRKGAVDAECAKRAGFPDVDAWVIIENTKRRGAQVSA